MLWSLAVAAALSSGFLIGLGRPIDLPWMTAPAASREAAEVEALRSRLAAIEARQKRLLRRQEALEGSFAGIADALEAPDALAGSVIAADPDTAGDVDADVDDEDADEPADTVGEADERRLARMEGRAARSLFNGGTTQERLAALEAAGLNSAVALDMISTMDRLALQRLEINYQAEREGWLRTDRHREAMQQIPAANTLIREQYGDDAYDRYLFASGRSNRIRVQQVMIDSAASQAGLQPGDVLVRVDGQPVFSNRDLMSVAREGTAGELVPVEVVRENQRLTTYLPRGPLGVRTRGARIQPGRG